MAAIGLPPVAFVDEPNCIGCARCLPVCPTDAIVGAFGTLHTVIAADCTGCEKCLPVCPTDCITLRPRENEAAKPAALAARWRERVQRRKARLAFAAREAAEERRRQREALRKRPQ
ncbi:MAG TPA: RnfABCDGE type electron transport complex subunit B [Verrucomicrobiae bacterium]|nr:RnfABCDGE type electron transport complex subunit B [Verrucomicrobiae bacterium]